MTSYSPIEPYHNSALEEAPDGMPRIDVNLWEHKLAIGIHWTILFISSCVIPIVLYFALRYGAHLELSTVLAVTTAIFGVVTLFSIMKRFRQLLRVSSTCRPLGASRVALDYFQWNFLAGFCCVTAVIVAGNVTENIRIVALGLPILLIDVCGQFVIASIARGAGVRAPFRMSSVEKGDKLRGGAYALAEDIVAVDGNQGQHHRRQLQDRYLSSRPIQSLCARLDWMWGVSGLAVAAVCFGLIFGIEDANVAYVMGWIIPWAYAVVMAITTILLTSSAVKKERALGLRTKKLMHERAPSS